MSSCTPTWRHFSSTQDNPRYSPLPPKATLAITRALPAGDALLFGPETRGLPEDILDSLAPATVIRIPMQAHSRSLNLSNRGSAYQVYGSGLRQAGCCSRAGLTSTVSAY